MRRRTPRDGTTHFNRAAEVTLKGAAMACNVQDWSLKDLTDALNDRHIDKKRIAVPMFQRGTRWKRSQEETLIDSLKNGYPVGTMLFYETFEDGHPVYLLVDGLQRGNTIRKYITKPTDFFSDSTITDEMCGGILAEIGEPTTVENVSKVRAILTDFVKAQQSYENLQYFEPAVSLLKGFSKPQDVDQIKRVVPILSAYFKERQDRYTQIAQTILPVVIYRGEATNLDEIFERINSKGTPLNQYEVYAASWPNKRMFHVSNQDVIDAVVKKYDSMESEDFKIYGYDSLKIKKEKNLTAFEYLFGLGKALTQKVDILRFITQGEQEDAVNPLAFELVNACLNESNKIPELYKHIGEIKDINQFEQALRNAIDFVKSAVSVITRFKGNNRNKDKNFHSKFQIMSMISTTFKEMYPTGDYSKPANDWASKKDSLAHNLVQYYVYDILTNYWSEGGTGKIFAAAKPNRYRTEISPRSWASALNGYFERSMQHVVSKKIPNPGNEEYVFLNCIYLHTFTAIDQLSADKFDVEHLAPKEQLKRLIAACGGEGLAIGSIANLCYLPEVANRSKGAKTLYQDKNYLKKVNLSEIEDKFSFTDEDDLEWLDLGFEGKKDFLDLKEFYEDFCTKRFAVLKQKFCESMGIEYVEDVPEPTVFQETAKGAATKKVKSGKRSTFVEQAIQKIQTHMPELKLEKKSKRACVDKDGVGYYFVHSKAGKRSGDRLYWYAYRREPLEDLAVCKEVKVCCIMDDDGKIIVVPQKEIEAQIGNLHSSKHDDGSYHWHLKFARNDKGQILWLVGHEGKGTRIEMKEFL
jgi:hypothetical protein